MVVKTSLFFRSFLVKKDSDGKENIVCSFLDDEDNKYVFSFPNNDENKKYMKLSKDTKVELSFNLYRPTKAEYKQYALFVR